MYFPLKITRTQRKKTNKCNLFGAGMRKEGKEKQRFEKLSNPCFLTKDLYLKNSAGLLESDHNSDRDGVIVADVVIRVDVEHQQLYAHSECNSALVLSL